MARPAPQFNTNRSADRVRALTTTQDMRAVALCPDFGPQRVVLIGTGASGAGSVTLTTEDGAAVVVPLLGQPVTVDAPFTHIAAITTATVVAHWWVFPGKDDHQIGPFPLNPA